jgi:hypothetical protein
MYQFVKACSDGNLNYIKQIIIDDYFDIHKNNELGFRRACLFGHKHIVAYLINLYKTHKNHHIKYNKINIYSLDIDGFSWASEGGYYDVDKYVLSFGSYTPNYNSNFIIIILL